MPDEIELSKTDSVENSKTKSPEVSKPEESKIDPIVTPATEPKRLSFNYPGAQCQHTDCDQKSNKNFFDPDTNGYYCENHIRKCNQCEENHYTGTMRYRDGQMYCKNCAETYLAKCPNCKELVRKDDILPPTSRNSFSMKSGGCTNCSVKCNNCERVVDKDNQYKNEDSYCEDCYGELFFNCDSCGKDFDRDDANYLENGDGEYCSKCFDKYYTSCYKCETTVEKTDAHEVNDEYYCDECYKKLGGAPEYKEYTEKFKTFSYTKKDKFFNLLYRILPISVKDLKTKYPSMAQGLGELISFSKGQPLTPEIVRAYRETLLPEEFPVEYTVWDSSLQRSVKKADNQLTINILASEQMLSELNQDPALYRLFDSINKLSNQSDHPYVNNQIGWARIELDEDNKYLLVDEIQSDHSNAGFQLKDKDYIIKDEVKKYIEETFTSISVGKQVLITAGNDPALINNMKIKLDENPDLANNLKYNFSTPESPELKSEILNNNIMWSLVHAKDQGLSIEEVINKRTELKQKYNLNDYDLNIIIKSTNVTGNSPIDEVRSVIKKQYNLGDQQLNNLFIKYSTLLKDFPNIASQAITKFAQQNNIPKIFWHTYESGKKLKNNDPPKSLYDKTPKENLFAPSKNKPFGLEGEFFEREAGAKSSLYKLARRLYLKCLSCSNNRSSRHHIH